MTQARLISPQNIEPVVLKFSKLQDNILYAVPGGSPVLWCLNSKHRDAFKFYSGGSEYLRVNKYGTLAAKPGRHEDYGPDVLLQKEVSNFRRGI